MTMQSTASAIKTIGIKGAINIPLPSDLVVQSVIRYSNTSTSSTIRSQRNQQEDDIEAAEPPSITSSDDKLAAEVHRLNDYQSNSKRKRWIDTSSNGEASREISVQCESKKRAYKSKRHENDSEEVTLFLPKILEKQIQLMEQQNERLLQQEERLRLQESRMQSTDKVQDRQNSQLMGLGNLIEGQSQKLEQSSIVQHDFFRGMNKSMKTQIVALENVIKQQIELTNTTAIHTEQIHENSKELWNVKHLVQNSINEQAVWNSGVEAVINGQNAKIVSIHKDLSSLQQCIVDLVKDDSSNDVEYVGTTNGNTENKVNITYQQPETADIMLDPDDDVVFLRQASRLQCPHCKRHYVKSYLNAHIASHCRVRKYC